MSDLRLPCREGNPDDWFIGRDGKQYGDEDLLSEEEVGDIFAEIREAGHGDYAEQVDRAVARAEADAKREALGRRRRAKEACHDCLFRTRCLQLAIDEGHEHGTWGGYYEEELRAIRREIEQRNRA